MPEYLSPGVFIEEVPSRLKAIEGVSTSTAAFVGPAQRGPVPGQKAPFTASGGFVLTPDPAPLLVTSFAEFQRQFGPPLPLVTSAAEPDTGYLGHAVRAFFDNGGRRCFITRIVTSDAKPCATQVQQGVTLRLLRSAKAGDTALFFTSIRGIKVGDTLTFTRHSDGTSPLSETPGPAILTGASRSAPFALQHGDQISIEVAIAAPPATTTLTKTIHAQPAKLQATMSITDLTVDGAKLLLRVGAATEPVQSITFSSADPIAPITAGATTAAEVAAVFAAYATGVRAYTSAGGFTLETDVRGTNAHLEILGSTSPGLLTALGLSIGAAPIDGANNVADVDHVSINELRTLLGSTWFDIGDDGASHLRVTTKATGTGVTLTINDGASTLVLDRLGLGSVASATANGTSGASPITVDSYNLEANTVTLSAPLTGALDANNVSAVASSSAAKTNDGPKFIGRTPGEWSANVNVSIACADRQPIKIAGSVAAGQTKVPVQSVSTFYPGAIIAIGHASGLTSYEVKEIDQATRVLTLSSGLSEPVTSASVARVLEIDITISDATGSAPVEVYQGLSWGQGPNVDLRRHYASVINARSRLVWVQPPGIGGLPGSESGATWGEQPTTTSGFPVKLSTLGDNGLPMQDDNDTWIGEDNGPGQRSGIQSLKDLTEVRIVAAPGKTSSEVQLALITQCELMRYRFAILDGERDPQGGALTSILSHRNLYDSSFAAYYQPWFNVTLDGQTRSLPPSGYLAGIYARVDNARGVWKAPANESVFNVASLRTSFTTGEQDMLNPRGVNLVRRFDEGGIRVWGARTLSGDPDLKYINVRRTLIFLEASIDRGTQWVVFEPNTPETWSRLTDSVSSFLDTQWRSGALFGRSPEAAFFVRCDESTMTADDILNGRLICHIGVAIVRPAEFVIFRIEQITNFGKQ